MVEWLNSFIALWFYCFIVESYPFAVQPFNHSILFQKKSAKVNELGTLINHFHFYLYAIISKKLSAKMRKVQQRSYFWGILFCLIFWLTQDYLYIKWDVSPLFFGLPNWLFWLIGVHALFIFTFYFFTKKYWK